ncbi:unnamed protein product [Parascedosporium putredinis]|uniref:Methyltransferase type 11 domain-containing protein n=1 Tax=Parascedosporium putredinis TaxID=1442378 RepID=A0A9P1MBN8_9PEZI|nr:unnamed protein product [Parascedosporium putredinis]CAI7995154.1 unnamed protein product [Parascedosporium putredinis]
MSIFGRTTYSAASYAAFRPSYPPSLFNKVLAYHAQGSRGPSSPSEAGTLLDLGCGHGLIARALASHFRRVIGVDPSRGMIEQARSMTIGKADNIEFRQGKAEELQFLDDGEIDMVVVGQAAHWFDMDKLWPELARVVKKGGSLAIWGYKDNIIVGQPEATKIYDEFTYSDEKVGPGFESMGPYWEQPGRQIIRDSLQAVKPPSHEWVGELGEFEGYVRSFSAYVGWRDNHPESKPRTDGGSGDIVDVMFDQILEAVPEWKAIGPDGWREEKIEAIWGTVLIMARRK